MRVSVAIPVYEKTVTASVMSAFEVPSHFVKVDVKVDGAAGWELDGTMPPPVWLRVISKTSVATASIRNQVTNRIPIAKTNFVIVSSVCHKTTLHVCAFFVL